MIGCDLLVERKFNNSIKFKKTNNQLLKTGIIVSIGLAIHNFPEGLAIRFRFWSFYKIGIKPSNCHMPTWYTRRDIYGSTHEKRRNENRKSHLLCRTIRHHNRNRSLLWSHHRIHIYPNHILMSKLCSRSHAIHRIPENLYQKLTPYTMEEWQPFGNILGFLIGIFATGI